MHTNYYNQDSHITDAFGPLTAMVMRRKRLLTELHACDFFRWHGEHIRQELLMLEFEIRWYMFEVCDPSLMPIMVEA
jgi:hypothetical protein